VDLEQAFLAITGVPDQAGSVSVALGALVLRLRDA
jgi:hypothetical protein